MTVTRSAHLAGPRYGIGKPPRYMFLVAIKISTLMYSTHVTRSRNLSTAQGNARVLPWLKVSPSNDPKTTNTPSEPFLESLGMRHYFVMDTFLTLTKGTRPTILGSYPGIHLFPWKGAAPRHISRHRTTRHAAGSSSTTIATTTIGSPLFANRL